MDDPQKNVENAESKNCLSAFLQPIFDFIPILAILLFLGALFWAEEQDPFSRKWFTVLADGHRGKCVAVLPKPPGLHPVVIYAHGSGGSLMTDGNDLRQMAEMGLAVVSLDFDQTNEAAFASQFEALLHYVNQQSWANTNAIAWVGFSLGANRMLDFAIHHPEQQPQLLVQLSGAGLPLAVSKRNKDESILHLPPSSLRSPLLLVHGGQDEICPMANTRQFAAELQSNGVPAVLKIIPGAPHSMDPDRAVVFRCIGEYCLAQLGDSNAGDRTSVWQDYHSIARWQAEAPSLVWFWLPAGAWLMGGIIRKRGRRLVPPEKRKLERSEIGLRWVAAVLALWALTETSVHLLTPHFLAGDRTLAIARKVLVQDKEHADFETLACQPIWKDQKLRVLLDHVELAGYNRQLINWQLDQKIYEKFVLSPVITGEVEERFNWRRALWEECYPRVRHESSPEDAARIVARHLRERVTVLNLPDLPQAVQEIWARQITDSNGFEILYVAALRSVGVPARLDAAGEAEFYDGAKWVAAPRPAIYEVL